MAQFTKRNGDFLPVQNMDSPAYTTGVVNAYLSAATVQPQGPKLDFWTVTGTGTLSPTQVGIMTQVIQQLATIYIYEFTTAANDTFAFASYPTAAWTAATLKSQIEAAFTAAAVSNTVTATATSTFTN